MTPLPTQRFRAFVPLSNWIRGYDRYARVFDKTLLTSSRFKDAFYVIPHDDEATQAIVLERVRALITRLNVPKDAIVCLEMELPVDATGAVPNTTTGTGLGWRWPHPRVPVQHVAWVNDDNTLQPTRHEDVTAHAFALNQTDLVAWDACAPRTLSVLPIARACMAKCSFCFSKASVSDAPRDHAPDPAKIVRWAQRAHQLGAERAVITGGGEPMILPHGQMAALIGSLGSVFSKVLLITNAHQVVHWADKHGDETAIARLVAWRAQGLSRIAISRHGVDRAGDTHLMGLDVDTPRAAHLIQRAGIPVRHICVLHQGHVDSAAAVRAYLERSAAEGVGQVCFKELYVSSMSENPWAPSPENIYAANHQVPLSVVLLAMEEMGFVVSHQLPWGSPVFHGVVNGVSMHVAAYTEPSVGWERHNGVVRSWNLMSDGQCLASLEDPNSTISPPNGIAVSMVA